MDSFSKIFKASLQVPAITTSYSWRAFAQSSLVTTSSSAIRMVAILFCGDIFSLSACCCIMPVLIPYESYSLQTQQLRNQSKGLANFFRLAASGLGQLGLAAAASTYNRRQLFDYITSFYICTQLFADRHQQ